MADVDVIIPCYNYAHYLEGCVASILSQRDVDVRILIVDDCSPDNTEEVGRRLAAEDARVHYSKNPQNLRLIGTANRGILDWAQSRYTLLISADDALTPGALSRAVEVLDSNPEAGMLYGMAIMMGSDGPPPPVSDNHSPDHVILDGPDYIKYVCEQGNAVPSPCAIVRTELQQRLGGYDPALPHTSDMEMWLRFASKSDVAVVNAPQGYYRWHSSNMSQAFIGQDLSDRKEQIDTLRKLRSHAGETIKDLRKWVKDAEVRLVREALLIASQRGKEPNSSVSRQALRFALKFDRLCFLRPHNWKPIIKILLQAIQARSSSRTNADAETNAAQGVESTAQQWFSPGQKIGWWPGH
ncbi:glycosyltransferase family 2 protein [Hyphomonas oceanitis]|uniref:glycosyltransferase family 2 protein n=1 Tax=Hyphomonas oceanitis TaxID=81033 RepID=UPI003001ABE0